MLYLANIRTLLVSSKMDAAISALRHDYGRAVNDPNDIGGTAKLWGQSAGLSCGKPARSRPVAIVSGSESVHFGINIFRFILLMSLCRLLGCIPRSFAVSA